MLDDRRLIGFRSAPIVVLALVTGIAFSEMAQADNRSGAFRDAKRDGAPPGHRHRDAGRHSGHSPYRTWDTKPNPVYPHHTPTRLHHASPHHHHHHHQFVHRGARFYYHSGRWYRAVGSTFVAVAAPIGVVVHVLPPVYRTVWINHIPYYYADNVYYVPHPQGYVVTAPPGETITEQPATSAPDSDTITEQPADGNISQAPGDRLFIYPRQGQSKERQEQDRSECHRWAVDQTGYDPNIAANTTAPNPPADKPSDYFRAVSACLEGRGYTVK